MTCSTALRLTHDGLPEFKASISIALAENRELYREMLKLAIDSIPNLEVVGAVGDGCQVLKLVAAQQPDLALIDLELPGINGLQSLALIREFHPATRVIIMSTEDSEDVRTTCLAQGADGFICKRRLYPDLRREIALVFQGRDVDELRGVKQVG
jgi:DNA-binding NarL/FixJ family response regulator